MNRKTKMWIRPRPFAAVVVSLMLASAWLSCIQAGAADAAPSESGGGAGVFDVKQFGAVGDGQAVDTDAIQKALDECGKSGGTVRFGPGTYLSKPLNVHSRTTIELEAGATLKATDETNDFHSPTGNPATFLALINGKDLSDVTITGPGTIDGSGARWWVPAEAARRKTPGFTLPRPRLILITRCKNLRVHDVTLENSPSFHLVPIECDDVVISNVTIKAPANSPNTDAIDPSLCRNVLITACHIDVGDDNVAIKSGRKVAGREFGCENITVTDCVFLHGHGMSIGSETIGGVSNVLVRNCRFENTENGIRIKSQRGKGGVVTDIRFEDLSMQNVDPAITFTCYYMNNSAGDPVQRTAAADGATPTPGFRVPVYRDIHIKNVTATCRRSAGTINGLPDSMISDVELENVQISAAGTGLQVRNAKGIRFKNVQITAASGPPVVQENAEVEGAGSVQSAPAK